MNDDSFETDGATAVGLEFTGKVKFLLGFEPSQFEKFDEWPLTGIVWFNGQPFDLMYIIENHLLKYGGEDKT